jgi:hypothetical protein
MINVSAQGKLLQRRHRADLAKLSNNLAKLSNDLWIVLQLDDVMSAMQQAEKTSSAPPATAVLNIAECFRSGAHGCGALATLAGLER